MASLCPVAAEGKRAAPGLTVGEVVRAFLPALADELRLGPRPRRVLGRLAACGTPALGAHVYRCAQCHRRHVGPRSCGDRHCPRCLAAKSRQWAHQQLASLLPVPYYHGVFTLPPALHGLVQLNPARLYPLLFEAASQTLLQFGRHRLGGDLGITAVLHTWGQPLNFHPHLHCLITGGALRAQGRGWRGPKQRKFLFPVRAVAVVFRGKFLAGVKAQLAAGVLRLPTGFAPPGSARRRWFSALYARRWNVFAKRPFGGPEQVVTYLAHYTHRVAMSNRRLVALDRQRRTVTFTYRDYRRAAKVQTCTLRAREFLRRFSWHILPPGLVRIRHFGILANNRRSRDVPLARALLARRAHSRRAPRLLPPPPPLTPPRCPHCGAAAVQWIGFIDAQGRTHLKADLPICDSS